MRDDLGLTVSLNADIQAIPLVRYVIRQALPIHHPSTEAALYLGAVTEVLANAVEAHQRAETDKPIVVSVHLGDNPGVNVCDHGWGFDPGVQQEFSSAGLGMGLRIVRSVCPEVEIESSSAGTNVWLPLQVA